MRHVRARVEELTALADVDPADTVGFVLLFIPNEAVYGFVHERDPTLLDDALAQNVVLCSPCTLFAVLGVIRRAVDAFALSRTSDEILECLNGFAKQWESFTIKLEQLGKQLDTAQRSYEELSGARRRQLQRHLDRVEVLRQRREAARDDDADDALDDALDDVMGDGSGTGGGGPVGELDHAEVGAVTASELPWVEQAS